MRRLVAAVLNRAEDSEEQRQGNEQSKSDFGAKIAADGERDHRGDWLLEVWPAARWRATFGDKPILPRPPALQRSRSGLETCMIWGGAGCHKARAADCQETSRER